MICPHGPKQSCGGAQPFCPLPLLYILAWLGSNIDLTVSVIAVKWQSRTYLTALLPKDQVYDEEDENVTAPPKKPKRDKGIMGVDDDDEDDDDEDENNSKCEPEVIDNPYLRPVKVCSQWNVSQHSIPYRS